MRRGYLAQRGVRRVRRVRRQRRHHRGRVRGRHDRAEERRIHCEVGSRSRKKNPGAAPRPCSAGELIAQLRKTAVDCGAYTEQFYDLTPAELCDLNRSAVKRRTDEARSRAVFAWHTAYLTGLATNAPRSFPQTPERHFGALMQDDTPAWKRSQAAMARIAAVHNQHYREEAGHDR
nr:MAG TPA: hypothetical protein [Caudoviricetes sp.]